MTAQTVEAAGLGSSLENMTGTVARYVADTGFEAFDAATVARAKIRIIDALGNIAAGHRAQGNDAVLGLARRWGGAAEATVLVHGVRLPAHTAAMVNAVMLRSYDFEPIGAEYEDRTQSAAHISGTTIPMAGRRRAASLLGPGPAHRTDPGDDLTSRFAAASGFDVYSGQDNTGTVYALGGTVVAAKLWARRRQNQLDPRRPDTRGREFHPAPRAAVESPQHRRCGLEWLLNSALKGNTP